MLRMASLYMLLTAVAVASASCSQGSSNLDNNQVAEWNKFKQDYKKHYNNTAEDKRRMNIYLSNKYTICMHNLRYEKGLESYSRKINQFSDMTQQEYSKIAKGFELFLKVSDKLIANTPTNKNV